MVDHQFRYRLCDAGPDNEILDESDELRELFNLGIADREVNIADTPMRNGEVLQIFKYNAFAQKYLYTKIEAWRDREIAYFLEKQKEDKANAVIDKALCLTTMIDNLPESGRTIPGLIAQISALFQDDEKTLCLSSGHRSKGREWEKCGHLPARAPSQPLG